MNYSAAAGVSSVATGATTGASATGAATGASATGAATSAFFAVPARRVKREPDPAGKESDLLFHFS